MASTTTLPKASFHLGVQQRGTTTQFGLQLLRGKPRQCRVPGGHRCLHRSGIGRVFPQAPDPQGPAQLGSRPGRILQAFFRGDAPHPTQAPPG